ncbi:helix-turn-helix domain-containing protein [Streptomyces alfalfae]|uniref:Helix-turn-helix domain-containing protein n=1 Tax=Streptomyces alfalfae TaxID=1642299 RepID=A0A7T4PGQ9_9ACTN|nr:helix-turn-helix transcriptional regulator [Streptomyces alfalfae]QQC89963.1 helix-turn-helix domain-containing protein [Streptomyces alfalfae]QUI32346.1 helix-turn-helix domain-containing protein [Streptomyces alfalfae]
MHQGERGSETFGALLRFYRERAGITQEALGTHVQYSKSQVAMVERGERAPRGRLAELADQFLGAQGALTLLAEKEFGSGGLRPWTEGYLAEERKASALHVYQSHVIPGSLQTEAYARAIYSCHCPALDDEELENRVAARLARQELFQRKPAPVISYVLEQSTLTRPLGGHASLKEQLRHILGIARLRHVQIQVMPHDRQAHAGLNGPMILLETSEHRQLAYVEGPSGGYFVGEQPDLGHLFARYGILRAQALNPDESATLIDEVAASL